MTDQQKENLRELRDYLVSLQPIVSGETKDPEGRTFDMGAYHYVYRWDEVDAKDEGVTLNELMEMTRHDLMPCRTAGCAVGHAATIIPMTPHEKKKAMKNEYGHFCKRALGVEFGTEEFQFLFNGDWDMDGNPGNPESSSSPTQAAARINYLLEKGLPERDADSYFPEISPVDWM